jgi:hypothetical protein
LLIPAPFCFPRAAIDHEGGVVGVAVVGPDAGLAVVAAAGFERARVEAVHGLAAGGVEADVQAGHRIGGNGVLGRHHPELRRFGAVAQIALALRQALVAERREGRVVEPPRRLDVTDTDGNVIDHGASPSGRSGCACLTIMAVIIMIGTAGIVNPLAG